MDKKKKALKIRMTPVDYAFFQLKFARDSLYRAQESFIECRHYSRNKSRNDAFARYYTYSNDAIEVVNVLLRRLSRIRRSS
jgi:hypothetical protein